MRFMTSEAKGGEMEERDEKISGFAAQFKADITPITNFEHNFANLNEQGISSLRLGVPVRPASSRHPPMEKRRALARKLRPALITIGDRKTRSCFDLGFGVLQSRRFPEEGWVKEWRLIHKDGKFWLCLSVQVRNQV